MTFQTCQIKQLRSANRRSVWWCDAHGGAATGAGGERLEVCGQAAAVAAEDPRDRP